MEEDVNMLEELGITQNTLDFIKKEEKKVNDIFKEIDENCRQNSLKVLSAFHKYNVSEGFFLYILQEVCFTPMG